MANTDYKPLLRAIYKDDDVVLSAVKSLREKGMKIKEVYSPFPIHGLDKALGLKETRIAMAAFMYGLFGLSVAITMTAYMMNFDWPQNIGGKPSMTWGNNMPAFVPILFELTVFFAAHLMVWTFMIINKLYPGAEPQNPDPRTTDDHFMIEVIAAKGVIDVLKESGAKEISEA
ncbi:MAG: Uncharacterised protein [Owenweeksia sp. TMED14]|nr:MAG: Uncharacterised protein [Owenweeksia sp. TMED14]|tara:strand:+ start:3286 stop:3804 length:519 start_codon:yes stop_codon:yes gene_type:complete